MLLDQECLYYYACAFTLEECLICKLSTHTVVNKYIKMVLQNDFNKKFGIMEPTMKSTRMMHAVIEGADNNELRIILDG